MKVLTRHQDSAGNPARPRCRNCGAPSVFRVYEPGRLVTGYCRKHFHRLVHVRPGARVTW